MTRIPGANRILTAPDRNEILDKTQMLMDGCRIGDQLSMKTSRDALQWIVKNANEIELLALSTAILGLANQQLREPMPRERLHALVEHASGLELHALWTGITMHADTFIARQDRKEGLR